MATWTKDYDHCLVPSYVGGQGSSLSRASVLGLSSSSRQGNYGCLVSLWLLLRSTYRAGLLRCSINKQSSQSGAAFLVARLLGAADLDA